MDIIVKKPRQGAKKNKGHKGKQQSHNKETGKYSKQASRTATNKVKNIKKAKALKKAKDDGFVKCKTKGLARMIRRYEKFGERHIAVAV